MKPKLTIGMAVRDDFDGMYFTVQSLRLNHKDVMDRCELIVIDNGPDSGQGQETEKFLRENVPEARYVPFREWHGTTVKGKVFEHARAPWVMVMDAHVLVRPTSLSRFLDWTDTHEAAVAGPTLYHGVLMHNDLKKFSSHMEPKWRGQMYGTWARSPRAVPITGPAFDIPMHGMGMFACRKDHWPGFNPLCRGFGVEEGYIHEKFRRQGGNVKCLPGLRWLHRFDRPTGIPYPITIDQKFYNYIVCWEELEWSLTDVLDHYEEFGPLRKWLPIMEKAKEDWQQHQATTSWAKAHATKLLSELNHART